jgi:hypothetical protein
VSGPDGSPSRDELGDWLREWEFALATYGRTGADLKEAVELHRSAVRAFADGDIDRAHDLLSQAYVVADEAAGRAARSMLDEAREDILASGLEEGEREAVGAILLRAERALEGHDYGRAVERIEEALEAHRVIHRAKGRGLALLEYARDMVDVGMGLHLARPRDRGRLMEMWGRYERGEYDRFDELIGPFVDEFEHVLWENMATMIEDLKADIIRANERGIDVRPAAEHLKMALRSREAGKRRRCLRGILEAWRSLQRP